MVAYAWLDLSYCPVSSKGPCGKLVGQICWVNHDKPFVTSYVLQCMYVCDAIAQIACQTPLNTLIY